MQIGTMGAREIARYFEVYKMYILDNNLDDDSKEINITELVNFVDNEISPEDFKECYQKTTF